MEIWGFSMGASRIEELSAEAGSDRERECSRNLEWKQRLQGSRKSDFYYSLRH